MENRPIIALVGRPNVGKSTLFNRLVGRREAITSFIPGTTRDRHFGVANWFSNSWTVIDTAGVLFPDNESELEHKDLQRAMEEQVDTAVREADLIALVVDIKDGIHPNDERLVHMLRKQNKPVVVLANKADNGDMFIQADNFYAFGIENVFGVSGLHGRGVSDFIDYLLKNFPYKYKGTGNETPKIAIIGRPNVGKSTLINRVLNEKRLVVSDVAGTTRDSITVPVTLEDGNVFELVDTAGIRRRGQIEAGIEKFSLFRTLRAINHADVVILVLSIEENPARGDAHIAMYALESNKQIIIALNKGDMAIRSLFKLSAKEKKVTGEKFLSRFAFMKRMPFYFISAQTGEGVKELLHAAVAASKNSLPVDQKRLDEFGDASLESE